MTRENDSAIRKKEGRGSVSAGGRRNSKLGVPSSGQIGKSLETSHTSEVLGWQCWKQPWYSPRPTRLNERNTRHYCPNEPLWRSSERLSFQLHASGRWSLLVWVFDRSELASSACTYVEALWRGIGNWSAVREQLVLRFWSSSVSEMGRSHHVELLGGRYILLAQSSSNFRIRRQDKIRGKRRMLINCLSLQLMQLLFNRNIAPDHNSWALQ